MADLPEWPPPGIEWYYSDGHVAIAHGDCREVLPLLPKVDLVLTDPPYGVGYVTTWRSLSDPLRRPICGDESLMLVAQIWPVVLDTLAPNRHWYAFASPRMIGAVGGIFQPKQWLFWDKGDNGTLGDLRAGYAECVEAIAYGMKGRRELNGPRPRGIIRVSWSGSRDPVHPTVKPVQLLAGFVRRSSAPGELVLDPFMGSGTTLRAAKDLGRRAIGIEIEEQYCEIAARRMAQEVLAL